MKCFEFFAEIVMHDRQTKYNLDKYNTDYSFSQYIYIRAWFWISVGLIFVVNRFFYLETVHGTTTMHDVYSSVTMLNFATRHKKMHALL